MKKEIIDWRISIAAIFGLVILQLGAMHYGINGTMRTIIFTMIALIAGISLDKTTLLKLVSKK